MKVSSSDQQKAFDAFLEEPDELTMSATRVKNNRNSYLDFIQSLSNESNHLNDNTL